MARIVALIVVAVLAATPVAALAAAAPGRTQAPFQQQQAPVGQDQVGEQPPSEQQQQTPPPQTQVDDGRIGARETLLIALGVVALIGGIWFVIARDAKRATAGRLPAPGGTSAGSATRPSRRSRRLSVAERRRRKRGRAS